MLVTAILAPVDVGLNPYYKGELGHHSFFPLNFTLFTFHAYFHFIQLYVVDTTVINKLKMFIFVIVFINIAANCGKILFLQILWTQ